MQAEEEEEGGGEWYTVHLRDEVGEVEGLDHGEVAGILGEEHLLLLFACRGERLLALALSAFWIEQRGGKPYWPVVARRAMICWSLTEASYLSPYSGCRWRRCYE